jgi:hypothetical protein
MWYGGMKVEIYNPAKHKDAINKFFDESDVENNISIDSLAIEKREDSGLFLVIDDGNIAAMSYAHNFSKYRTGGWRVFTRTATHPAYRGKGFPHQRNLVSAAGLSAYTLPMQVSWARLHGAKSFWFTTNYNGGMASSDRLGRFLDKIVDDDPRFSFSSIESVYYTAQRVWQLHYGSILPLGDPL